MNIKDKMYVRDNGYVYKHNENMDVEYFEPSKCSYEKKDILEHGDYVNGYKIIIENDIKHILTENGLEFMGIFWNNDTIKEIVTHERFEEVTFND